MKFLTLISLISLFAVGCSSNKYDKKRLDLQKQEAKEMIESSDELEIKKGGWGDDKIIIKD